jgi:uncharacterized protein
MPTRADILKNREAILAIARRNGASNVRIFGSMARGEETDRSDLDLLVHFDPATSLMDYGMLVEELQDLLGINVDVVSEAGIDEHFREAVSREMVPL